MSCLTLLSALLITDKIYLKISPKIQLLSDTKPVLHYWLDRLSISSKLQWTGRKFFGCGTIP
jgi:hypothetical protein